MNKLIVLLKTLLLSTSSRNIYRYSGDKKKRRQIVGGTIGMVVLFLFLMGYCIVMCVGYGSIGIIEVVPEMCALLISLAAFVFTLFKTNGYLFNFKEYDVLMSLPLETRTVAASKFLYMYIKSLPWYLSISLAMMIGYGYYAHPSAAVYPVWIILSFFLPVIPMLFSAFLGFLIARVSAGHRKTNIIQTVLMFLFVIFCFSLQYIIDGLFKNDKVEATLENISEISGNASGFYLPARWFSNAVTRFSVADILLLIGLSALLFAVVFYVVGRSYRNINSSLKSHAAAKKYKMSDQNQHSVIRDITLKELKRMTGSTTYITNGGMGVVLSVLLGIVAIIFGFDKIIAAVTHNAPVDAAMLYPAIPFFIYFFVGMVSTTAMSPSLEGRNYWIVQSLPIEKKTLYQGKMLFNMELVVPAMVFSTLCLCLSAKVPLLETILYLILGFALCAFSTAWGCVCGVRHLRLDWENEVEVIKQGAAVTLYILPNLFAVMILLVVVVILGMRIDHRLLAGLLILIVSILAALSYRRVMILAERA